GREEGLFAGELFGRWFGRRMWSLRRFVVAVAILVLLLCVGYFRFVTSPSQARQALCNYCDDLLAEDSIFTAISFFISFSVSASFTKFITIRMANLCGDGQPRNLLIFSSMLIVTYLQLTMIKPISEYLQYSFIGVSLSNSFPYPVRAGRAPLI